MIEILPLSPEEYSGRVYHACYRSDRALTLDPVPEGFSMRWVSVPDAPEADVSDAMLAEWWDSPVGFGAFREGKLIGFVDGFHEKWNNRFRVTNLAVFDPADRRSGIGAMLMERVEREAVSCGARMTVLETCTANFPAVRFYGKHGYSVIGFDRYAYSNHGPEEHNMRLEMGKILP